MLMAFPALALASELQDMAELINNNPNATWTAGDSGRFGSFAEGAMLCGTFLKGHRNYEAAELDTFEGTVNVSALADSLDLRTAHPECKVISKIRDQSACGSCWAFGSTESFEDRRCISTGDDIEFSALDTATNGNLDANGCKGGQPTLALKWMTKTGVVTGGDYADDSTGSSCMPYAFAPCAHHTDPGKYPACPKTEYRMTRVKACTDKNFTKSYNDDKIKGSKAVSLKDLDVAGAMAALQKGTVSVAFTIYEDFLTYKSGVYKHITGKELGGHAVAFIGYGTDPTGGDYWLVKNSWNEQWGDGGTFKIARGTNECAIEQQMAYIDF